MRIAVVTTERFNEIDTFVAFHILNRLQHRGCTATLVAPSSRITSMNGVVLNDIAPLEAANSANVVLFGSGWGTKAAVDDDRIMSRLSLNEDEQLIGSQCSGALFLAKLGLLRGIPACTDRYTRPELEAAGVHVIEQSFHADGSIASAGGCLSAVYLATWVILRMLDEAAVDEALSYVSPVGEHDAFVANALRVVRPLPVLVG